MNTRIDEEKIKLFKDPFYTEYFELLINRITHSSMSLEKDLGDPDNNINAIRLRDNMRAFKKLINMLPAKITEETIIEIANTINASSIFISNGYRKLGNYITDTNIPISSPDNISNDIKNLLKKYETSWKELDCFEREAKFHIEFIRIHPFEDGNGRTSRLLLNYNLLKQKIAPVIITEDLVEYYQSYIKNNDIDGMKKLFQIQSQKELSIINKLYEEYKNIAPTNYKKR